MSEVLITVNSAPNWLTIYHLIYISYTPTRLGYLFFPYTTVILLFVNTFSSHNQHLAKCFKDSSSINVYSTVPTTLHDPSWFFKVVFYNFELYFYYIISNYIVIWCYFLFSNFFLFVFKNHYICVICFKLH